MTADLGQDPRVTPRRGTVIEDQVVLARVNSQAIEREQRLLATQFRQLLAHHKEIAAWPAWRDIRVAGAACRVAYLGGGALPLGAIVSLWSNGIFATVCPRCGRRLLVFRAIGSPRTGIHRVSGFCEAEARVETAVLPRRVSFADFVLPAKRHLDTLPEAATSQWSLGQLLAHLDADVDDIAVLDGTGRALGTWCHRSATLVGPDGRVLPAAQFGPLAGRLGAAALNGQDARWRDVWGPANQPTALTTHSATPFDGGAWRGEVLTLSGPSWRRYIAHPGVLASETGDCVASFDGVLPPAVLVWLAARHEGTAGLSGG